MGTVSRVELCPCAGSLVLSLGALSLRLDFSAAQDLAATMTRAVALLVPRPPDTADGNPPDGSN